MSCQLVVWGRRFEPQRFLERVAYRRAEVRIRDAVPPSRPIKPEAECVAVSNLDWRAELWPTAEAGRSSRTIPQAPRNQRLLFALRNEVGIEEAKLEFGIRWEDVMAHGDRLLSGLIRAAGDFGLTIVITHYPVDDYTCLPG